MAMHRAIGGDDNKRAYQSVAWCKPMGRVIMRNGMGYGKRAMFQVTTDPAKVTCVGCRKAQEVK